MTGKLDRAKGELKEQAGNATGDDRLEAEGKLDQAKGKAKESVSKAKDAFDDLKR
jgi:uncharacterized protein YjbJ (UPF0337 family)